ncbi:MAG: hypothetical protein BWY74_00017 [Firmicutes bacterium ADurb.Bin419]|nr:MAG: hypothetical protein BWY74_00017 [Firmicutes bacterium ADurb.Bin419]
MDMDFIKKIFNFINVSGIFTIAILGLRLFSMQISDMAKQSNLSYVDIYLNSNVPVFTITLLIAGITAFAVIIFSQWSLKVWLKINLGINSLLLAVVGLCSFFYFSSVEVKLIMIPLMIIYLVVYISFKAIIKSGCRIEVIYEN